MKDLTKKVVILENLASPYVHQAIIVMRDYNPKLESRAVLEAERIVSAYLDNMKLKNGRRKKTSARKIHSVLLYCLVASLSAFLTFILLRF